MPLHLNWVGDENRDRIAHTRMLCYAHSGNELEAFRKRTRENPAAEPGDFLLAEQDGTAVGTTTSLSMTMWVRGAPVPCQGVAWVGTIKTHRRRNEAGDGVATQLLRETLRKARERQQVLSALMPFRGSFYEHFGYGFVERRNKWTLPLAVLPHGAFDGIRFYEPGDLDELVRLRQRVVERGQCDIERPRDLWASRLVPSLAEGFVLVDRPDATGPIHGMLCFEHHVVDTKDHLRITESNHEDIAALRRQLHFLASLRDQYRASGLTLPVDLALNWLLRESQVPHRFVNHAHPDLRQETRMQVRVLDHKRFLEGMKLPGETRGKVVVTVHESEGHESRFAIDVSDGRAGVASSSASPQFSCADRVWAAIATGDLAAERAVAIGVADAHDSGAIRVLDCLSVGPKPFSNEYF